MTKKKTTTTITSITLEIMTVAYVKWLISMGETNSYADIFGILVENYVKSYAEVKGLDFTEVQVEAMKLFELSRRTRTKKNIEEQRSRVKAIYDELEAKNPVQDIFGNVDLKDKLKGDF